ncbi:carbohydrate-binding module family 18 protein [Piromyces sp. E2]|nr:carbohydrate-binding module family 18 protein [Piromyces sp. E2]|eukprot:OUM60605.1 carbohydrate-binding module family 18 protein [Piromyces sp. E2]
MKLVNFIIGAITLISTISAYPNNYSKERCGSDYGECKPGYCCNKNGWCGNSDDHCLISKGCQYEYGICKDLTINNTIKSPIKRNKPTITNKPTDNIEYAGFRFSPSGVRKSYNEIPNGNKWIEYVNKMVKHFNGAKPIVVVVVSENSENTNTKFGFKKPSDISDYKYINYSDDDLFEDILTAFDNKKFNVWLQVEPGNNDLTTLANIVFKKYGHHSCVKGFGVDLEWWYRGYDFKGKALSDLEAKRIVEYVRGFNENYTVLVKHWETSFMPPSYRDHMIFIDDNQGFKDSLDKMTKRFGKWAKKFPNNPVMFQIGYKKDEGIWENKPIEVAKAVAKVASEYNKQVGILWVDYTMKKALATM